MTTIIELNAKRVTNWSTREEAQTLADKLNEEPDYAFHVIFIRDGQYNIQVFDISEQPMISLGYL